MTSTIREALSDCISSMKFAADYLQGAEYADSPWQRKIGAAEKALAHLDAIENAPTPSDRAGLLLDILEEWEIDHDNPPMHHVQKIEKLFARGIAPTDSVSLEKCAAALWSRRYPNAMPFAHIDAYELASIDIRECRDDAKAILHTAGVKYVD